MKKIIAFLLALVIFFGVVFGFHVFITKKSNVVYPGFGTWRNIYKYASYDSVARNLNPNSLLLFGSSEFNHNFRTPYHPANLFANQKIDPMILGTAYSQSLTHAISLGSLEPKLHKRKAALILSPQWFNKTGVKKEAYAVRFSESSFVELLSNENLSLKLRRKLANRSIRLLKKSDPTMYERCRIYKHELLEKKHNLLDELYIKIRTAFVKEKDKTTVLSALKLANLAEKPEVPISNEPPNWKELYKKAQRDGLKSTKGVPFNMSRKAYEKRYKPIVKSRKNADRFKTFSVSPEYDDLKLFLEICKETNIEPLLIMIPVNGHWYDYTAFPKKERQQYYENIRQLAKKYNANLADLSKYEYTKSFMLDSAHLAWKGWLKTNESIYNFYNQEKI
ncbi:MAG: D-alanyl-lipoteichoic acid biosynthesis protein DltD [Anaerovoracaceae bacterium]